MIFQPSYSVPLVVSQNDIIPSWLFTWKKLMQDDGMPAIKSGDEVVSAAEYKGLQKKVKQLEQLLDRKQWRRKFLKSDWR